MARNKTLSTFIISFAILIWMTFTGCTHNNGDIGPWFGAWTLNAIEIDGNPSDEYPTDTQIWKFQSNLINVTQIYPYHYVFDSFGSWEQLSPTLLELNFGHSDNTNAPGEELYAPPVFTHLPAGPAILNIETFSGKRLVLTYRSDTGVTYTYRLSR